MHLRPKTGHQRVRDTSPSDRASRARHWRAASAGAGMHLRSKTGHQPVRATSPSGRARTATRSLAYSSVSRSPGCARASHVARIESPVQDHKTPVDCLREMGHLIFNALLHRARRIDLRPSLVFLVARRLMPPPVELAPERRKDDIGCTEPSIPATVLYACLCTLKVDLPPASDGLLRDFVLVIKPLSLGLMPRATKGDHSTVLLPPPPVEQPEQGFVSAVLGLIGALAPRPLHRLNVHAPAWQ
jgi:hypothetical protein